MKIINHKDITAMEMPAGRQTRVIIGPNGALQAEHFVQGIVRIYPGGTVPPHDHSVEESYTIISGQGRMMVDGEDRDVCSGDTVYISPGKSHGLANTSSSEDLIMMFVYAPSEVVDHWAEEQKEKAGN